MSTHTCRLFAVTGFPLTHTLSPAMHTAALRACSLAGRYVPFEIVPSRFAAVMKRLAELPFQGMNVTVPYKERMIPFLDGLSDEARAIGAVNTVVFGKKIIGHNTDAYGFTRSLKEDLKFSARGKRIFIIGAGGAARACVYALASHGARAIMLADGDEKKAVALARVFSRKFKNVSIVATHADAVHYTTLIPTVDLLVNATPVGLKADDPLIVPKSVFAKKKPAVYDLVYNPAETKLLAAARKYGCRTANGLGMLLYQGARAFELWTRRRAPAAVMRRALKKAISHKL